MPDTPYADLLDLPAPRSRRHPPMSMEKRAAQFLPFSVLNGYGEALQETARQPRQRPGPDEERQRAIDEALRSLERREAEGPALSASVFVEDGTRQGGTAVRVTGKLRRLDSVRRLLLMEDGRAVPIDDLLSLHCEP